MKKKWAEFTEFAARFLCEEAARVFVLPIAVTIGLGVMGWLQDRIRITSAVLPAIFQGGTSIASFINARKNKAPK